MQTGKIFSKNFLENCAFYGLDTEPEPELVKSWNRRNQNHDMSKVGPGTGAVINSDGSLTLVSWN
jgi:hypothetical protein